MLSCRDFHLFTHIRLFQHYKSYYHLVILKLHIIINNKIQLILIMGWNSDLELQLLDRYFDTIIVFYQFVKFRCMDLLM